MEELTSVKEENNDKNSELDLIDSTQNKKNIDSLELMVGIYRKGFPSPFVRGILKTRIVNNTIEYYVEV